MSLSREEFVREISRLNEEMFRGSWHGWCDEWMELEITLPQLKVLFLLFDQPPTRMSTLADGLNISSPSCTGLIDRLVKEGMVDREEDPSDRRLVLCALSERGREAVGRLWRLGKMHTEVLLEQMTLGELHKVAEAMTIFRRAMDALESLEAPLRVDAGDAS